MANEQSNKGPQMERAVEKFASKFHFSGKFAPPHVPLLYSDGIASVARDGGTVKFYLVKFDPSIAADGTSNPIFVAQVVMPAAAFAAAAILFHDQLENMVENNEISRKDTDELQQSLSK